MHSPMAEDLEKGEDFPNDSISAKEWKTQHHQAWDTRKSLHENLWQREEYALFQLPRMDDTLPWAEPGDAAWHRRG